MMPMTPQKHKQKPIKTITKKMRRKTLPIAAGAKGEPVHRHRVTSDVGNSLLQDRHGDGPKLQAYGQGDSDCHSYILVPTRP
jgi:hypothetical protein